MLSFDLLSYRLRDLAGADFNVYEVDFGIVEPSRADVLVSEDGIAFVSVNGSRGAKINLAGDEGHGSAVYAYSYDLAGSGLTDVRYVRVSGNFTSMGGLANQVGFDMDAMGIASFDAVPEPGAWTLMITGIGLTGAVLRRRSRTVAVG